MKNLLSENMLRFGTKNLSESMKKSLVVESIMQTINEHGLQNDVRRRLLTEAVTELMTDPGAAAALKSLKAQITKGTALPGVVMGQYYLKVESNSATKVQIVSGVICRGKVGSLIGRSIAGVGLLPVPTDMANGLGGILEFSPEPAGQFTILNYDDTRLPLPAKTADIAAGINAAFNQYPIASLQAMLAAHAKKATFDTAMVAFKASASAIKPLLTGNAKIFYGV
jgi:hypothetical protein